MQNKAAIITGGDSEIGWPYFSGSTYICKMSNFKKEEWSKIWDALFWNFMHLQASYIGAFIFTFGFFYEALDDFQLDKFMNTPENKEKILQAGLWKYSRHPNYFGEAVLWWGIWIQSLIRPVGFFTIIGPITIAFLLRYVSGVPLTKRLLTGKKDFQAYAPKTSPFIPWFVKK